MTKSDLIGFETEIKELWEQGKIDAPLHLSGGNEDQLLEIFKEIKPHDYVFSTHRNHYHALLHGCSPDSLRSEILGESQGRCLGRARSMGFIDHSAHFYSSAIVGGCAAIAVGVAWSLKRQWESDPLSPDENSSKRHVWCFVGDGAMDGGHFWESLQYASAQDLPITFVVENNHRATCSSIRDRLGSHFIRFSLGVCPKVYEYFYKAEYPHVGSGKYVQF